MKLHAIVTLLVFGTLQAQNVTEVPTDRDFLAGWLNRSTTIEIAVPDDARSYAVSFGPDAMPLAMAATLHAPAGVPDRVLQVMVMPPDQPGGNGVCDEHGLAGIYVNQSPNGLTTSPNYVPFCVPYPDHPTRDERGIVINEQPSEPGHWQPIYLHTWKFESESVAVSDQSLMFAVHISFSNLSHTVIPDTPRLTTGEILELESVQQQNSW